MVLGDEPEWGESDKLVVDVEIDDTALIEGIYII